MKHENWLYLARRVLPKSEDIKDFMRTAWRMSSWIIYISPSVGLCNHAENLIISVLLVFCVPYCRLQCWEVMEVGEKFRCPGCVIAFPCTSVWSKACWEIIANWTESPFLSGFFFEACLVFFFPWVRRKQEPQNRFHSGVQQLELFWLSSNVCLTQVTTPTQTRTGHRQLTWG